MQELKDYISEDLVITKIDATDQFMCIQQLGELLYEKGYVKETYVSAVQDREKVYPTGLFTDHLGVAIPHTDAIHVNKPAVAIGTLERPVDFRLMGSDEIVSVWLVFQLAISSPQEQVHMLQNLVGLFTNNDLLENLKETSDPKTVISLIHQALEKNGHKKI